MILKQVLDIDFIHLAYFVHLIHFNALAMLKAPVPHLIHIFKNVLKIISINITNIYTKKNKNDLLKIFSKYSFYFRYLKFISKRERETAKDERRKRHGREIFS